MKTIVGKVVVLGHQGVGKTSTVIRYVENSFSQHITPTVGASFFSCKLLVEDITVKLQIWDTAGQERFKAMAPMFYRNANAALIVFDITSTVSFESMQGWVVELTRNVESPMVLCVVGNKIDLAKNREVSRDDAIQYARSIGATYHECSAMHDQGVGLVFDDIARGLVRMSGSHNDHNLKVYDTENIDNIMANSSELEATDTGKEETVNLSISSIAHGNTVKPKCC
ncbi:ras-related protein RABF2b [Asbolus verrucosus]|uniref:Ras-related protein RABF2b n=1 Tax=Asbolus verrucosus TaxID=1661398 RepID=A0A482VWJ1_ASBVE|nr:ras-related protein RABF2b [Asbolus verrucosus]